ncbi:MAG: hypothetical protein OEZ52_06445 [Candidatus Aminicenantes bacterium]|nr:hypothetical protein [Candidatus Aminicenantes bacterium]
MTSEKELIEELKAYAEIFPKAWRRFLVNIESGDIYAPMNEAEMRCYLFSECLSIMREGQFPKPCEITAEDKEILEGKRADISLGLLEDGRFVVIELKLFPEYEPVKEDIEKLLRYVRSNAVFGFFGMIANSEYDYERKIDLEALGIQKEGEHFFYEWSLIQPPNDERKLVTLLVGLRGHEQKDA